MNLYVDIEPQKNYRPGYPIEKRGIYYLSRRLCSQLDVVTEKQTTVSWRNVTVYGFAGIGCQRMNR